MRMGSQLGSCSLLFLIFLVSIQGHESARGLSSNFYPHEPPVETFQTAYGDQIGCVNIYSQPAFASPFLTGHQLQKTSLPSFPVDLQRDAANWESTSATNSQLWSGNETCPEGTVPIIGSPNLSADLVSKQGSFSNQTSSGSRLEFATMNISMGEYQGGVVDLNIWNPRVEGTKEYSSARIRIGNVLNFIEVGWHVYPALYNGTNQTRLYVYWTKDGYRETGCFNLLCPGFVQVSTKVAPGAVLPVSEYGGQQLYARLLVVRDKTTGNWVLGTGTESVEVVGYWPNALFTDLALGATLVEWGGEIVNDGNVSHTATQMGSGRFPTEGGDGVSAFCGNLYYVDGMYNVTKPGSLTPTVSKPKCYNITDAVDLGGSRGYTFYYGGPGRNENCT